MQFAFADDDLNEIKQADYEDDEDDGSEVTDLSAASAVAPTSASTAFHSLPIGEISNSDLPVFLKQPQDAFLIKSKPATLQCRVANALKVYFQCNSEIVEPTRREDHVEPESGIRYAEAFVDINRDQVEEYFSEYHCACVAFSAKGSVMSDFALVTNACKTLLNVYSKKVEQPSF